MRVKKHLIVCYFRYYWFGMDDRCQINLSKTRTTVPWDAQLIFNEVGLKMLINTRVYTEYRYITANG